MQKTFEDIKSVHDGVEFWYGRDLMEMLGYTKRDNFVEAIQRAKASCKSQWKIVDEHFFPASGKTATTKGWRPLEDYILSRYACYLIAMNGDPRKIEISNAQNYFATLTRTQELSQIGMNKIKRIEARERLKEVERKIESTIYHRGITKPEDFSSFKNTKIQAMYGMDIAELKKKRNIPSKRALADFDSELELKAKDFVYAMTDHNIKSKKIVWKEKLTKELESNAASTRKAMLERGIIPEELPAQEDLKVIQSRRNKQKTLSTKKRISKK